MRSRQANLRHVTSLVAFIAALALAACGAPVDGSTGDGGGGGADGGGGGGDGGNGGGPTWYRDVLPIVNQNCYTCHRSGGIAPFSLEEYSDAAALSNLLVGAVETRTMPPWNPAEDCQPLKSPRVLTDQEIATFRAWHDAGAPEGDPANAPSEGPPEPPRLDRTDLVLDPGVDYTPNDQGQSDDYRCFLVDPALTEDAYITGIQVNPGTSYMVHHVLLYSGTLSEAEQLDADDPGPGWTCFGGPGTGTPETLGGWAPGTPPTYFPEGTGIRLAANNIIVMQVHYNFDNGPATADRTSVELKLADGPVTQAYMLPFPYSGFEIPPNTEGHTDGDSISVPVGATVWGVFPHMHDKGRRISVTYTRGGQETCLMQIDDWDFNWQQFFFYDIDGGIRLRSGDTLHLTCTWDNPTDQPVRWGDGTADEMCLNYFYTTL